MLGIVHHSPLVITVLVERARFQIQMVTEDEAKTEAWRRKVENFSASPRSTRDKILFIEKVDSLRLMIRDGFEADDLKIVIYDVIEAFHNIEVDIIDARLFEDTWALYELMPERLNGTLGDMSPGVPSELGTRKAVVSPLAKADAVMQDILGSIPKKQAVSEPEPTPEPEPEPTEEADPKPRPKRSKSRSKPKKKAKPEKSEKGLESFKLF